MAIYVNNDRVSPAIYETPAVAQLRAVIAETAGPVSVVTTIVGGRPAGVTVSGFMMVSFAPPMFLVSLPRESELAEAIISSGRFGVSVLAENQSGLAAHFSQECLAPRFHGFGWEPSAGLPRLEGAAAWVAGRTAGSAEVGDHLVIFGVIEQAEAYGKRALGSRAAPAQVTTGTRGGIG